jgi:hypothetical protein
MFSRSHYYSLAVMAVFAATIFAVASAEEARLESSVGDIPGSLKNDTKKIVKEVEAVLGKYGDVVQGVSIGLGVIVALYGYKLVNPTLFLVAAGAVGMIAYASIDALIDDSVQNKPYVAIGVSISLGVLAGVIIIKIKQLGIFIAGAALGAVGAFWLYTMFLERFETESFPLYLYISLAVLCPLSAYLANKIERIVLIIATSVLGSFVTVAGIGRFVGHFPSAIDDFGKGGRASHDPYEWAYLAGFVFMSLAGMYVQIHITAKEEEKGESADGLLRYSQRDSYSKARPQPGEATYILVNGNNAVGYA